MVVRVLVAAAARAVAAARLQGAGLPDALGHAAGHVARGGGPDLDAGQRRAARDPGVRNAGSHIGQAFLADEVVGRELRRELDQHRPGRRLRRDDRRRSRRSSTATPASTATCRRTFGSGSGRCSPAPARRSSCASSATTWRRCARRPTRWRRSWPGSTASSTRTSSCTSTSRRSRSRSTSRRPGATASSPGDVRRATATMLASEEVGDIFGGGKAYDVHVWTTPGTRDSLDGDRRRCRSTRRGAVGAPRRGRRREHRAEART